MATVIWPGNNKVDQKHILNASSKSFYLDQYVVNIEIAKNALT